MKPLQRNWQIPEYKVFEFRPRIHKYCICVFVINEGKRFLTQLNSMKYLANEIDIVIADGGSTDRSVSEKYLIPKDVRTLLIKKGSGKLSAQMRMAFAYALRQGYEGIVTIDGNNKDDPSATSLFIRALDEGFDHLQGSRFIKGGISINTPINRLLGIRLFHAPLISLSAKYRYTDTTNGFRAYSSRFLLDSRVAPFREIFSNYELHYYLAIKAPRLGYRVKEIPVKRSYPARDTIPTKISPLKGDFEVLKTLLKVCFSNLDPSLVNNSDKKASVDA